MTPQAAIEALNAHSDEAEALKMRGYHKVARAYLGVPAPVIETLCKEWRAACSLDERLALCAALWDSNSFEGRIAAAKLLTQARIRPDDPEAWALIKSWVPEFDCWAITDAVSIAGQKRLVWSPDRVEDLVPWITSEHIWTRRAALVTTLPWTKQNTPKEAELAVRDQVLGWAAELASDHEPFIQKAIAWWLRELSKHDSPRVHNFLSQHGQKLKPFAQKEAARKLASQDYARLFNG